MFVVGLGGYYAYQTGYFLPGEPVRMLEADTGCQLHQQACSARLGDRRVDLSLSPLPVPLLKPVALTATLDNMPDVQAATILIEGVNMFMGFQHEVLSIEDGGQLSGSFSLAICSESVMHWQITLDIQTEDGIFRAVLPFTTER